MDICALKPDLAYIGTLFKDRQNLYICNRASSIHKFDGIIVSFSISRYGEPKTLGEFIRKRRLENDLFAKELANLIEVTEDTVINWEKDRTYPSQQKLILLKERLDIDPFELIEFDGAISERQKSKSYHRTRVNYKKRMSGSARVATAVCTELTLFLV